jgi:hypothetical protein
LGINRHRQVSLFSHGPARGIREAGNHGADMAVIGRREGGEVVIDRTLRGQALVIPRIGEWLHQLGELGMAIIAKTFEQGTADDAREPERKLRADAGGPFSQTTDMRGCNGKSPRQRGWRAHSNDRKLDGV